MKRIPPPACFLLGLLIARGAAGDEFDRRFRLAVAYEDRKTDDVGFLDGLQALSVEQRTDLIKRLALLPGQARALFYYELARIGNAEAANELDALLHKLSITGRLRLPNVRDLEETVVRGCALGRPDLQGLAAGLLLAAENIAETTESLYHAVHALEARADVVTITLNDRRKAATTLGWLHLRKVWSDASQKQLANALRHRTDGEIRMRAAAFVGAMGEPAAARQLLEALRLEDDPRALERIAGALSSEAPFPPEVRWPLVPELARIVDDFDVRPANRRMASLVARAITGLEDVEGQLAWWKEKEKELAARAQADKEKKPRDGSAAGAPKVAADPKPNPAPPADPAPAPPADPREAVGAAPKDAPPPSPAERECARWLLMAKNHMGQRDYVKAEEALNRVLDKCPEGKLADEARELLKKVKLLKDL